MAARPSTTAPALSMKFPKECVTGEEDQPPAAAGQSRARPPESPARGMTRSYLPQHPGRCQTTSAGRYGPARRLRRAAWSSAVLPRWAMTPCWRSPLTGSGRKSLMANYASAAYAQAGITRPRRGIALPEGVMGMRQTAARRGAILRCLRRSSFLVAAVLRSFRLTPLIKRAWLSRQVENQASDAISGRRQRACSRTGSIDYNKIIALEKDAARATSPPSRRTWPR